MKIRPKKGSTGSIGADKTKARHVVYVKAGVDVPIVEVEIPGASPLQAITYNGVRYAHVSEHADGRWIYRPV